MTSWPLVNSLDGRWNAAGLPLSMAEQSNLSTDIQVATACPLDCPDACSLSVGVRDGRVVSIDGGHANDATRGYICAKVRRFPERIYGDDRLRFPMVRRGMKGSGQFARVSWDEALERVAKRMATIPPSASRFELSACTSRFDWPVSFSATCPEA